MYAVYAQEGPAHARTKFIQEDTCSHRKNCVNTGRTVLTQEELC